MKKIRLVHRVAYPKSVDEVGEDAIIVTWRHLGVADFWSHVLLRKGQEIAFPKNFLFLPSTDDFRNFDVYYVRGGSSAIIASLQAAGFDVEFGTN